MREQHRTSATVRLIASFQILLGILVVSLAVVGDASFSRRVEPQVAKLAQSIGETGRSVSDLAVSAEAVRKSFGGWVEGVHAWAETLGKFKYFMPGPVNKMVESIDAMAKYVASMEGSLASLKARGEAISRGGESMKATPSYAHWHFITMAIVGVAIVLNGVGILIVVRGRTGGLTDPPAADLQ